MIYFLLAIVAAQFWTILRQYRGLRRYELHEDELLKFQEDTIRSFGALMEDMSKAHVADIREAEALLERMALEAKSNIEVRDRTIERLQRHCDHCGVESVEISEVPL